KADLRCPRFQLGKCRPSIVGVDTDTRPIDAVREWCPIPPPPKQHRARMFPGAKRGDDCGKIRLDSAFGVQRVLGDEDPHARRGASTMCPSRVKSSAPGSSGAEDNPTAPMVSRA